MSKDIKQALLARRPDKNINWGAWDAIVLVVVLFFASQLIATQLAVIYPALKHWTSGQAVYWIDNSLVAQFVIVALAAGFSVGGLFSYIHFRGGNFIKSLNLTKPHWVDLPYALAGFAIYFPALQLLAIGLHHLVGLNLNQAQNVGFSGTYSGRELVLVFISLVLLPPIVEELLFRGFLFSGLKKVLPLIWSAIITSLLFAIPHLLESANGGILWVAGLDVFILSIVLCWLRQQTGRLYAGMLLHSLKNFLAFAGLYLIHIHS